MRLGLAIKAFFKVCCNGQIADGFEHLLDDPPRQLVAPPKPAEPAATKKSSTPPQPQRNDAITLLATLQREARFVDIVNEPLGDYNDAEIGAAARDVLTDSGKVLKRLFGLQAVLDQAEGETTEIPAGFDRGSFRISGNVDGDPPYSGSLVHHGWVATRCELPTWTGSQEAALVVAPAELEIN